MVLLIELYLFIPFSVTLTYFKLTAMSNIFKWKFCVLIQLKWNYAGLLSKSSGYNLLLFLYPSIPVPTFKKKHERDVHILFTGKSWDSGYSSVDQTSNLGRVLASRPPSTALWRDWPMICVSRLLRPLIEGRNANLRLGRRRNRAVYLETPATSFRELRGRRWIELLWRGWLHMLLFPLFPR